MLTEYFRNLLNLERDESMNVFEAIQKRPEITKFLDKTIPKDTLEQILDAGYLSPAGNNLYLERIYFSTKTRHVTTFSEGYSICSLVRGIPRAIVITGRPDIVNIGSRTLLSLVDLFGSLQQS